MVVLITFTFIFYTHITIKTNFTHLIILVLTLLTIYRVSTFNRISTRIYKFTKTKLKEIMKNIYLILFKRDPMFLFF